MSWNFPLCSKIGVFNSNLYGLTVVLSFVHIQLILVGSITTNCPFLIVSLLMTSVYWVRALCLQILLFTVYLCSVRVLEGKKCPCILFLSFNKRRWQALSWNIVLAVVLKTCMHPFLQSNLSNSNIVNSKSSLRQIISVSLEETSVFKDKKRS